MIKAEHSASILGRLYSDYVLDVFVIEMPTFVGIITLNGVGLQAQRHELLRAKETDMARFVLDYK